MKLFLEKYSTMDNFEEEELALQILHEKKEILFSKKDKRNHIVSLQETIDKPNEQVIQLRNEVVSLQDTNVSKHAIITHLQNENARLEQDLKNDYDLLSQFKAMEKYIQDLRHLNQDLVRQVSELSSTKGMPEACINSLQISTTCASSPALVGTPKPSSLNIGDYEIWKRVDMLQEVTYCVSQDIHSSSFDVSSHALVATHGLPPPDFEQHT